MKDFFVKLSPVVINVATVYLAVKIFQDVLSAKSKLIGSANSKLNSAFANSRGQRARKQGIEQNKQKAFLSRSTGNGIRGKFFRATNTALMTRGARRELNENLFGAQSKLEEQRISSFRAAIRRDAGLPYAPLIGQMKQGESGAQFAARYNATVPARDQLGSDQIARLDELRSQFAGQVGTSDFALAGLLEAHAMGSDTRQVQAATAALPGMLQRDGKSAGEISNIMGGMVAGSAKQNGFASLAYATASSGANYDPYGNKRSPGESDVQAATKVAGSVPLTKLEPDQIVDTATGAFTTFGEGLITYSGNNREVAARDLAEALKSKPKPKTLEELNKVIDEITVRHDPGFRTEVERILAGRT